jgi:hypothetical protein
MRNILSIIRTTRLRGEVFLDLLKLDTGHRIKDGCGMLIYVLVFSYTINFQLFKCLL